jgi:hypothetical protein
MSSSPIVLKCEKKTIDEDFNQKKSKIKSFFSEQCKPENVLKSGDKLSECFFLVEVGVFKIFAQLIKGLSEIRRTKPDADKG